MSACHDSHGVTANHGRLLAQSDAAASDRNCFQCIHTSSGASLFLPRLQLCNMAELPQLAAKTAHCSTQAM